jgi:predicted amidohydrolase YtcJ
MAAQWGKPEQVAKYLADPRALAMSPSVRMMWLRDSRQHRTGEIGEILLFLRKLTKALHEAGVPLLVGTDSPPIPGLYAGYSVHDDLQALRNAGLSNYEVLVAATRTPGEFIAKHVARAQRFGQIRVGMKADAMLVEGNPLESLDVLKQPIGVMTAGRWMTAQQLNEIIETQRKSYQSLY